MNVSFFGTPDFCVPSLNALLKSKHRVTSIVTQPDRPSGRGMGVTFSPAKQFAIEHKIPCHQPERVSREIETIFPTDRPDVIVTCAFGQILKQNVLDFCKYGVVNVHASLLPKYRGPSPINYTLVNGEKKTGITIMQTDIGIDTGDIITQVECDIDPDENAGELFERLSHIGAKLLIETLDSIEKGTAKRTPQNHAEATYFPMLKKSDARISFNATARDIHNKIRGMNPYPGAWAMSNYGPIKLLKSHLEYGSPPGIMISYAPGAEHCRLSVDIVQAAGGKAMPIRAFANGHPDISFAEKYWNEWCDAHGGA